MNRSWWLKCLTLIFFIVLSVVYVTPTVMNLDLATTKFPFKKKINLGLDLQGGLYMVLGVDFKKVYLDIAARQAQGLETGMKQDNLPVTSAKLVANPLPEDPLITLTFDAAQAEAVKAAIKKKYWSLRLVDEKPGQLQLGLSREYRQEIRDNTLNQSIEVIRNRIDEFGVAEPSITSQGSDRVVVELPGVKDVERAKALIGRTARLEFRIVNDKAMNPNEVAQIVAELEKKHQLEFKGGGQKFSEYSDKLNQVARAENRIPEDSEILFERPNLKPGQEDIGQRFPYLVLKNAGVSGEDLADAQVSYEQENQRPIVTFSMTPSGASNLDRFTADRIGQRMAIVLDNLVQSAPVLQARLSDRAQITLGSGSHDELLREAKDLAIVLRAGALPAQLEFNEQRVVGPSLGADSIASGARAGIIGCLLVFIFMIIYYRWSGVVATVSLLLNALFILAILIGMDATLTLPGIAGIALTIGMAVDSNVLIFERIRDEIREGKAAGAAVSAGFQKAFTAIFDANITHGIVATILIWYGTGPIRGFAVTLLVGIATTLFCAVTVCKLIFDGYMAKREPARLSI